jgi:hypothetical protein
LFFGAFAVGVNIAVLEGHAISAKIQTRHRRKNAWNGQRKRAKKWVQQLLLLELDHQRQLLV